MPFAAKPDGSLDGSTALFPGEAVSLTMWSLLYCGPDPQLGQIISAPQISLKRCELIAADSSCWGSRQYQTKSPMKALARRRWLPKIQINSCRCKGKSGLWFHCSPLYHCTSALKPDVAINAVKVLATPAQIPFQTQGLANLCRCTWSKNLVLGFPPHAFAAYGWLPLTGASWPFAFCLAWVWWATLYPRAVGWRPVMTCLFLLNWWNTQLGEKPAGQFGRNGTVSQVVPFLM